MLRQTIANTAALSALLFAGPAAAIVITTGGAPAGDGSGLTTSADDAIVETFDLDGSPGFVQGDWDWTTSDADHHLVSGSTEGIHAAPFGDETNYYSVGAEVPAWAQVDFGVTYEYLGLYWGSVDEYNSLDLLLDGDTVETITGSMVLDPADGFQGEGGSAYVNISDVVFDGARFSSSEYAFEFDNVAAGVPVPATVGLFAIGLFGLAVTTRRRSPRDA